MLRIIILLFLSIIIASPEVKSQEIENFSGLYYNIKKDRKNYSFERFPWRIFSVFEKIDFITRAKREYIKFCDDGTLFFFRSKKSKRHIFKIYSKLNDCIDRNPIVHKGNRRGGYYWKTFCSGSYIIERNKIKITKIYSTISDKDEAISQTQIIYEAAITQQSPNKLFLINLSDKNISSVHRRRSSKINLEYRRLDFK